MTVLGGGGSRKIRLLAARALPLLIGVALAGCYSPDVPDGELRCSADHTCPDGYHCALDETCWHDGLEPDLAVPDAARDAPVDARADSASDGAGGGKDGASDAAPDQKASDAALPDLRRGDGGGG